MKIRKATECDIAAVSDIFDDIHTAEELGKVEIGWARDVYPTRNTAEAALERGDLFVAEAEGMIIGTAIINQQQVDVYKDAKWQYDVPDDEVMVLHTLVISPRVTGKGYGRKFVGYYEAFARSHGCRYLRIDTNERNVNARALYQKLGYEEIDMVPCVFNGIEGVHLVLLEKKLFGSVG